MHGQDQQPDEQGHGDQRRDDDVHRVEPGVVVIEITLAAQAIPSYAPQNAMQHFKKVECFCFKQQALKPNEARQMPVMFYIDPKLPREVKTITLSYTFFEVGGTNQTAQTAAR